MSRLRTYTAVATVCVAMLLGTSLAQAKRWRRSKARLETALRRELGLTRTSAEIHKALIELDRERASLDYTASILGHASRESMRKLDAYRRGRGTQEAIAHKRGRALYKLSRGGVVRLAFEDIGVQDAEQRTSARLRRGQAMRFLVRHDLEELARQRRAEHRATAELAAAGRELQALSAVRMIEAMQEHALVAAEQSVDPELRRALRARRKRVERTEDKAVSANKALMRIVRSNWRELRALRGLDGASSLIRPVPGRIVGKFGSYRDRLLRLEMVRNGVELRARANTPVRAMADGTVVLVTSLPGLEQVVVIDHGGGQYTLSARVWDVRFSEGEEVAAGSVIAQVAPKQIEDGLGSTLYVELRHGEKPVDPTRYLRRAARRATSG